MTAKVTTPAASMTLRLVAPAVDSAAAHATNRDDERATAAAAAAQPTKSAPACPAMIVNSTQGTRLTNILFEFMPIAPRVVSWWAARPSSSSAIQPVSGRG